MCGWLGGRAQVPSRTQAPGQGPRLFMRHRHVFSCAFPHVPVHWPRPCAAKVTLPDSSKVHPPNVLLPNPVHFRLHPEIGDRERGRRSTGAKVSEQARRPGRGIRSASPLSAASKPALHPAPAFFLRTTTILHPQAGSITNAREIAPLHSAQLSCATPRGLLHCCKLPRPVSTCLSS